MTETAGRILPLQLPQYTETETDAYGVSAPLRNHRIDETSIGPLVSEGDDPVRRFCHHVVSSFPREGLEEALGHLVEMFNHYVLTGQWSRRLQEPPGDNSIEVDLGESRRADPWYLDQAD